MPIIIERELVTRLRSQSATMVLLRCLHEEATLAALRAAMPVISDVGNREVAPGEWEGGPGLSGPISVPSGYLLMIDTGATPPAAAGTIPGLLARRLTDAGVTDAEIGVATEIGDRYLNLERFAPSAQALLCGPADRVGGPQRPWLDQRLADIALLWLRGQHQPGAELIALVIAAELPATWDTIPQLANTVLAVQHTMTVLTSDFRTEAACASLGDCLSVGVSLTAAGSDWPPARIVEHMREQRDLIRANAHLPALQWAMVTAQPAPRAIYVPQTTTFDETAAGSGWYRVLSPQMADRLATPPPGSAELGGGRLELTVGEPEQWIPGHPDRDAVVAQERALLAAAP